MNTVATRHPAILAADALKTVATELVRADVAATYFAVHVHGGHRVHVSMNLRSRKDFDSAAALFGFGEADAYDGSEGSRRVMADAEFMGVRVSANAPAFPAVVPDCDAASLS